MIVDTLGMETENVGWLGGSPIANDWQSFFTFFLGY
jgi:hypothetical protein